MLAANVSRCLRAPHARSVSTDKPNHAPGRTLFTYTGSLSNVPFPVIGGASNLLDRAYTIAAEITVPQSGGSPMADGSAATVSIC
ncbi:hypothetical protein [Bradyrhizobium sp. AUGA SZCCT0283]|uniref:hypothetical protein n=1 Tax=Bradyrhizobium sp. AUGA SZCCT0283 TaxID=2807671 RepID=UPI001BAAA518|nr:hypothetical protein [Bradyrhizobium sp. AUGA SZCCT0283]